MAQAKGRRDKQAFDLARDWRHVNYLQPVYDELGGNSTIINFGPDRAVTDRRTVKTVLKSLAGVFAVDLSRARKKYGAVVCRRSSAPIPLNASLVMLPIKMRNLPIKGDGAWGYVVLEKIKGWEEAAGDILEEAERDKAELVAEALGNREYRSIITFHDGTRLATMVSQATIYSLIKDGEMARKKYVELLHPNIPAGDPVLEAREHYLRNSWQAERMISIMEEWIKKIN